MDPKPASNKRFLWRIKAHRGKELIVRHGIQYGFDPRTIIDDEIQLFMNDHNLINADLWRVDAMIVDTSAK